MFFIEYLPCVGHKDHCTKEFYLRVQNWGLRMTGEENNYKNCKEEVVSSEEKMKYERKFPGQNNLRKIKINVYTIGISPKNTKEVSKERIQPQHNTFRSFLLKSWGGGLLPSGTPGSL